MPKRFLHFNPLHTGQLQFNTVPHCTYQVKGRFYRVRLNSCKKQPHPTGDVFGGILEKHKTLSFLKNLKSYQKVKDGHCIITPLFATCSPGSACTGCADEQPKHRAKGKVAASDTVLGHSSNPYPRSVKTIYIVHISSKIYTFSLYHIQISL